VDVRNRLERVRGRLDLPVLGRIAQSALAAGAAWELALQIPGHGQPFFAPIAAVIALDTKRGRRGRQAIQMMVGVALGILIGAAIVAVAGTGAWQLVVATAVALAAATGGGANPLIRIQAAASAILVVALHRPGTDLAVQRLVDALIGGGIAILLARILFPVDPLALAREEARWLRGRLAESLDEVAAALDTADRRRARSALGLVDSVDERRLEEALTLAREIARKAPRRRPMRRRLEALGASWQELDASVSDAHAVATGALRVLSEESRPAHELAGAVRAAAEAVRRVEPEEARRSAEAARAAAAQVAGGELSLGASVVAHGVAAVADHALRAAAAREEDARLAAGGRTRSGSSRVRNVLR
jgi:succinate dehydrogenase hydrophobic anchor subunit